jgi:hypothetical protein
VRVSKFARMRIVLSRGRYRWALTALGSAWTAQLVEFWPLEIEPVQYVRRLLMNRRVGMRALSEWHA